MQRLKILILHDEHLGIRYLNEALAISHDLTWTKTIRSATQQLDKPGKPFEIIICGTHLANESVFDFLKAVRAKAANKEIPVIFFRSTTSRLADRLDSFIEPIAKALGADAYISIHDIGAPSHLLSLVEAELQPRRACR